VCPYDTKKSLLIRSSMIKNEIQDNNEELPEPWYLDSNDLTIQLFKEIPNNHILFSKTLKTIGRRQDNDDVLFQLENDQFKYAVVHLTWSKERQKDNNYPRTTLYKNWDDLYTNRILVDKANFQE
jgi:hypothetical protein